MAPEDHFREALTQGRFELQFCSQTGKAVFYPRILSPYSGEPLTEWREVSGEGVVYSTTITRRKKEHGGNYNIALVDLDEGARMMSRIVDIEPDEVCIGMRVKARIELSEEDKHLVLFSPTAGEADND